MRISIAIAYVQALASYAVTMRTQELIAPGSAVSADDLDFGAGLAYFGGEIVQQVEDLGIVVADVARAVIAQVAIEAIERGR